MCKSTDVFKYNYSNQTLGFMTLVLVMLFSSVAMAQRVNGINGKGTKFATGNVVTESAAAPMIPTPITGDIWFDTSTNTTKIWDEISKLWKTLDANIPVYINAAARDAAITAPSEGLVVYMADTDELFAYNGISWVPVDIRIPIYTNAAARDAVITTPTKGLVVYMADTDELFAYNGSSWVPLDTSIPVYTNAAARDADITTPTEGLVVYMADTDELFTYNGIRWESLSARALWDADKNTGVQVEETTNDDLIRFDTAGTERMVIDKTGNVGIGTPTPFSKLHLAGSIATPTVAVSANTTLDNSHAVVRVNTTAGNITLTLPAAATATGRIYHVIKTDNSNNNIVFSVAIMHNGGTTTTTNIPGSHRIQSDGTNWVYID